MTDKKEKDKNNNERSDEINVSKCKYFNNGWCLLSESCDAIKYRPCGDMTLIDCYYRNWQRKEQECEELKRQYKELGQCSKRLKEYFEKEKETLSNRFLKLKQTLAEIKEIAKKTLNMVDYKTYFKRDNKSLKQEGFKALNEILQKISECEVENAR